VVIISRRAVKSTCTNILAILLAGINRHDNMNTQGKGAAFASVGSLPYGVAIAIGTLGVMFLQAGAGTR
jgi:prepilin peptidase CpaA